MNIEKKHTLFLRYMAIIALIFIFIGMIILQFSSTEEKLIVLFSLTIGYIILAVMVYSIYVNYVRPIQSILTTAKELTNRNYNARIYVPSYGDAQLLGNAVNTLARHLQEISIEQKVQASEWKTV